jgi:transposase
MDLLGGLLFAETKDTVLKGWVRIREGQLCEACGEALNRLMNGAFNIVQLHPGIDVFLVG